MTRKFAVYMIFWALLVGILLMAVASAEISVGVKPGDWIEYTVTSTGNVPEAHDVNWGKFEIIAVEGKTIEVNITSRYCADGREETETLTLNLETGQIGDAFIIPANLNAGDDFLEQHFGTITVSGVEERTCTGVKRSVVCATTPQTNFCWDKSTGVLVEANSTYPEFTMSTKAEETNMWQTQAFVIDPLFSIVLIALGIVAILVILLRRKMTK